MTDNTIHKLFKIVLQILNEPGINDENLSVNVENIHVNFLHRMKKKITITLCYINIYNLDNYVFYLSPNFSH